MNLKSYVFIDEGLFFKAHGDAEKLKTCKHVFHYIITVSIML